MTLFRVCGLENSERETTELAGALYCIIVCTINTLAAQVK